MPGCETKRSTILIRIPLLILAVLAEMAAATIAQAPQLLIALRGSLFAMLAIEPCSEAKSRALNSPFPDPLSRGTARVADGHRSKQQTALLPIAGPEGTRDSANKAVQVANYRRLRSHRRAHY